MQTSIGVRIVNITYPILHVIHDGIRDRSKGDRAMDPNEIYRSGDWCVMRHVFKIGDPRYIVVNVDERDPIEAANLKAAIEIVDCLARNAI